MTVWFPWMSCGRASGDHLAEVHDGDVLADAHDHPHLVLDEEDRELETLPDEVDEVHELDDLPGVHARRGLVEEEDARVAGKGARDLDPALLAVGEVLRDLSRNPLQLEDGQEIQGLFRELLLLGREFPRSQDAVRKAIARVRVIGDAHVVENGQVGKEPDVLERARDAAAASPRRAPARRCARS